MSLDLMKTRLGYIGHRPQMRLVDEKSKSMLAAIRNSYQAAEFVKWNEKIKHRGLFNPISQTMDYDTKRISIPFEDDFKVGDVFRWLNTNSYWIIYTQDRDELSYFRGNCRRCDYIVQFVDQNRQLIKVPISVVGPSNPQLSNTQSRTTMIDIPTGNLTILVTDNDINRRFFARQQTFYLKGFCYKVQQIDNVSMPGIIQIYALENYSERVEDEVETGIRNAYNVQPIVEHYNTEYAIEGPREIKPKMTFTYHTFLTGGYWFIEQVEAQPDRKKDKFPGTILDEDNTQKQVHVMWNSMKSGGFVLGYRLGTKEYKFNVIVQSLM